MTDDGRGVLYPAALPSFHREAAPVELADRIRWFWIPRWDLSPGVVSHQRLLPFPAANLVVEPAGVALVGPATKAAERVLHGRGWGVGALFRPAALAALHEDPRAILDEELPVSEPRLFDEVSRAMSLPDEAAGRRASIEAFVRWAEERLPPPDEAGLLANRMEEIVAADREVLRVDQLAARLALSVRAVQRLARRHVGLTPLAMIRRYRLQEAAQRLREDPELTVAALAAELGYSDHAHLSGDFRRVLGLTPRDYREESAR